MTGSITLFIASSKNKQDIEIDIGFLPLPDSIKMLFKEFQFGVVDFIKIIAGYSIHLYF